MTGPVNYPDTVFQLPFNVNFPTGVPAAGYTGGRLMSDGAHVDGTVFADAGDIVQVAGNPNSLGVTRNALGDYSLKRTAAGAETYFFGMNVSNQLVRTGETYSIGTFPVLTSKWPAPPNKGIQLLSVFADYAVGVVALTTCTLALSKIVYANGVARVVTIILAATGISTATSANSSTIQSVAVTPGFIIDTNAIWRLEMNVVMASTGTFELMALGVTCNFNYN